MLLFYFVLTFPTFKDCKENKAIDKKTTHKAQYCIAPQNPVFRKEVGLFPKSGGITQIDIREINVIA
jgi:hypothetical protein